MDDFLNDDVIMPDDTEEIPTEVTEEENFTEETPVSTETIEGEGETTPVEPEPFIKVKYNKEEIPLTQEQVIELSQKGMNYDKIQQRYNELSNNKGLKYIEQLAQRNGMQVEELVDYWEKQEYQSELNELVQKNIPEEYAREILESKKFRSEQQQRQREEAAAKQRENVMTEQRNEFLETYPNVEPKDIPQEVWDTWKTGVPLKFAYMQHERNVLENKVKALETNVKNKQKAPINNSITVNGSNSVGKEDAFLMGFNSI